VQQAHHLTFLIIEMSHTERDALLQKACAYESKERAERALLEMELKKSQRIAQGLKGDVERISISEHQAYDSLEHALEQNGILVSKIAQLTSSNETHSSVKLEINILPHVTVVNPPRRAETLLDEIIKSNKSDALHRGYHSE
jgi:hypothetical protein